MPTSPVWEFEQHSDEYVDYAYHVPDAGGYGVYVRLTLNTATRSAYLSALVNDEGGTDYAYGEVSDVPWAVACAMTGFSRNATATPPQVTDRPPLGRGDTWEDVRARCS